MAKRTYIAILEPTLTEGYGVSFPDLPGCVSFGDDLSEAVANAHEALSLHLEGMVEDGSPLPEPRKLADLATASELPGTRFVYASVSVEDPDAADRVNVYLPKSLIRRIEAFGERTGIDNRSTFLRLAAQRLLSDPVPYQVVARFSTGMETSAECIDADSAIGEAYAFFKRNASSVVIMHRGRPLSVEGLKAEVAAGRAA